MSLAHSNHLKYRAHIDGLRAIAVLSVLFFHADIGFPGGYVGVDVFFVISGYLIAGLILKDLDCGQFHIFEFWERRVRRILPALAVVVLSCLATGWFLFLP
jgi:peptidoglycan/LPS O-acetylase OafA/YrhL